MENSRSILFTCIGVATCTLGTGCEAIGNTIGNTACSFAVSSIPRLLEDAVQGELAGQTPQEITDLASSEESWNDYWNERLAALWDDDLSCDGRREGPSGRQVILAALERRQEVGLPELDLDQRNQDKALNL